MYSDLKTTECLIHLNVSLCCRVEEFRLETCAALSAGDLVLSQN